MQRNYFGVALVGSLILHISLTALFHFTALNAKQPIPLQTEPITLSLYEEPKKDESPTPQPKKIEKKQKIVQKQQIPRQPTIEPKQISPDPIKTATHTQTPQIASEAQQKQIIPKSSALPDQNSDEVKKYLSQIRKILQKNLEYPHFARKAGLEGVVIVNFCIKADGSLSNHSLKIIKSSGSSALDKQALETVQISAPFTVTPKGEMEVSIPVSFALNS